MTALVLHFGKIKQFFVSSHSALSNSVALGLFLILLSTGCTSSINLSKEQVAAVKKVGVVSLIEDKFVLRHVGTTIFSNSEQIFDSHVLLNNDIKSALAAELISNNYIVPDVKYDEARLRERAHDKESIWIMKYDPGRIKEDLKRMALENSLDAIIFVTSYYMGDPMEHTNLTLKGYGLYRYRFLSYEKDYLYFMATVRILNARTIEELAYRPLMFYKKIDAAVWKENPAMFTDDEKNFISTSLRAGIKDAVKVSLSRLGLIACNRDDYYCYELISEEK